MIILIDSENCLQDNILNQVNKDVKGSPFKNTVGGTSLAVQWLILSYSNEGSAGSIPCWGTEIPHAMQHDRKVKKINAVGIIGKPHVIV